MSRRKRFCLWCLLPIWIRVWASRHTASVCTCPRNPNWKGNPMHAIQAANIVNNLIFRPGWKFTAETGPFGNAILVTARIETQDTSYPPDYSRRIVTGPGPYRINVAALDEDDLMYEIKLMIEAINDHEDREFLRRGDRNMEAPFHPHRTDGQLRWDRQQRARYRVAA